MQIILRLNKKHKFTRRIGNDCRNEFTEWVSKNNLSISEVGKEEITFTLLNKKKFEKAVSSFKKLFV